MEMFWLVLAVGIALVWGYILHKRSFKGPVTFMETADPPSADQKIYDTVVIGGGPAGSSAAFRLAKTGKSVLVMEKAAMPRRKLCGGALSIHAQNMMDVPLPEHLIDQQVYGGIAVWGNHAAPVRHTEPIVSMITRSAFDHFLLQQAQQQGAIIQHAEARTLKDCGELLKITTATDPVYARSIVVAEGATGRLHKYVRHPNTDTEQGMCMEADIPLDTPGASKLESHRGYLSLYLDAAPWGYGWVFHHGSYLNVGIGALGGKFTNPVSAMNAFLKRLGLPENPEGMKGHVIPRGGVRRRLVADRIVLAGDAAGFVDAFDGEGLAYAIRSGQLAANTLNKALNSGDLSTLTLRSYECACAREFNRNLVCSLKLAKLVYRFPSVFLKALAHDEKLMRKFFELPLGTTTYRAMLGWLILRLPRLLWLAIKY